MASVRVYIARSDNENSIVSKGNSIQRPIFVFNKIISNKIRILREKYENFPNRDNIFQAVAVIRRLFGAMDPITKM